MGKERIKAGQLIPTSSVIPPDAGIYLPGRDTVGIVASSIVMVDPYTKTKNNVVTGANHEAEHAAMGIFGDGTPGACVTRSERNISHTVVTKVFLPSAPIELAILWVESGTSGNLKFVLEAASDLDADSRLANNAAHGEISSGGNILVRFTPTSNPMNIYLLATSAVGAGSNIATIIAKVTE